MRIHFLFLALFAILLASPAHAHRASDSFLSMQQTAPTEFTGHWDIALLDLERQIGIDRNADGRIVWKELQQAQPAIFAFALPALSVSQSSECALIPGELLVNQRAGENYASLGVTVRCDEVIDQPVFNYALLFGSDPGHRGFLSLGIADQHFSAIWSPDNNQWQLPAEAGILNGGFADFLREGIWHIWIGYDHIAFLILLLLPAVLRRRDGGWQPQPDLRRILTDVAAIITAFTVAHSITLSVAALGLVTLPIKLVEAAIAGSVVIAGLHNVFPARIGPRWALAFGFGLIHGFGFASVLNDLDGGSRLLVELAGFNIGVEIGQLAIALLVVPIMFALRSTRVYRGAVVPVASLSVALLACVWFVERAFS